MRSWIRANPLKVRATCTSVVFFMAMTPANVYLERGGWLGSAISFLAVSPIFGYSIYRILSAEEKRRLKQDSASEAASR
jgi:hypothetical protein